MSAEISWVNNKQLKSRLDAQFYSPKFLAMDECLVPLDMNRQLKSLGEIAVDGYRVVYPGVTYVQESSTHFLSPSNTEGSGFFLHYDALPKIPDDFYEAYPKGRLNGNQLLIEVKGKSEQIVLCRKANREHVLISGSYYWLKFTDLDRYYLFAVLTSTFYMGYRKRLTSNTVIDYIAKDDLYSLEVPYPDPKVRQSIGNKVHKAERLWELANECVQNRNKITSKLWDNPGLLSEFEKREQDLFSWINTNELRDKLNSSYYRNCFKEYYDFFKRLFITLSSLGQISIDITNGPHGGVEYVDNSKLRVPYIRAQNIKGLTVTTKSLVYIAMEDHLKHIRAEVSPRDLIMVITGEVGLAGVVPESIPRANIIQSLAKITLRKGYNPYYVSAYLSSRIGLKMAYRFASQTVQSGLNFEGIAELPVPITDKNTMNKIGELIEQEIKYEELSNGLIAQAVADVEALIEGTLDENKLLAESAEIEQWLKDNPVPYDDR